MEQSVLIAGFGGQGIMTIGKILSYAAVYEGKQVTFNPSYGGEQRGGTANCTIVISGDEILLPAPAKVDCLIAMNAPSLERFFIKIKQGGSCVINSSIVSKKIEKDTVSAYYVPANGIANNVGNPKVANMAAMGAYVAASKILDVQKTRETIQKVLEGNQKLIALNLQAFDIGIKSV